MIRISRLPIVTIEDYAKIKNFLPKHLLDDEVIDFLKDNLELKCDEIDIEYPYYDKDYLSTYYEHYAKKFRKYEKTCARLHVVKNNRYYGYITVRPSMVPKAKIGKTYLNPKLGLERDAYLMLGDYSAHITGREYRIKAFPWKRQQTDVSVCAHTAFWTVIRYFASKYSNFADATIGDIVKKVEEVGGRKTPSLGLTPTQVSELFKAYGFTPLLWDRTNDVFTNTDEILTYIESGLPVVAFIDHIQHAISIMGHGRVALEKLDNENMVSALVDDSGVIPHTRLIESVYVMDDRFFPYIEIPTSLPNAENKIDYCINEIRFAVVPLDARMQLDYRKVRARMTTWIKSSVMKWEKDAVTRVYLTSSNSLKRELLTTPDINQDLRDIVITLSMPKFVWCIDFAGIDNYKVGLTSGRIILDTTCCSEEQEPWILMHDSDKIRYKDFDDDPNKVIIKETVITPYKCYRHNLVDIGEETIDELQ